MIINSEEEQARGRVLVIKNYEKNTNQAQFSNQFACFINSSTLFAELRAYFSEQYDSQRAPLLSASTNIISHISLFFCQTEICHSVQQKSLDWAN